MMRLIKTGLLCIPNYDEDAASAVLSLLRRSVPNTVILADRHVKSQRYLVEEVLRRWCDEDELDLILTIGGTMPAPGAGAQEIAPEATSAVIERAMPSLPQAMRASASKESTLALLDRGVAGIRGRTLIVNLPAGVAAARFLEAIAAVIAPTIAHLYEDVDAPLISEALAVARTNTMPMEELQETTPPKQDSVQSLPKKKLDADEFAAFLRRQSPNA